MLQFRFKARTFHVLVLRARLSPRMLRLEIRDLESFAHNALCLLSRKCYQRRTFVDAGMHRDDVLSIQKNRRLSFEVSVARNCRIWFSRFDNGCFSYYLLSYHSFICKFTF